MVFIGLGSNLGDGRSLLREATGRLSAYGTVLGESRYMESEPWGFESPNRFTNAVIAFQTELQPLELLEHTQRIEREMGRTHKRNSDSEAYSDRTIDIDLLLWDDLVIDTPRLRIPHPHIRERAFVTEPLAELFQRFGISKYRDNEISRCRNNETTILKQKYNYEIFS